MSSQSPIPANPPAWDANTLYNKAGLYVTHKGSTWVSKWSITRGAEPGVNTWNGWKQVSAPPKWVTASAGVGHALAINEKGELYAWGYNSYGQLGDGSTANRSSPVKIAHP